MILLRFAVIILITILIFSNNQAIAQKALDQWHYMKIDTSRAAWGDYDEPEWGRYMGFDAKDINGDNYMEIISGRYFYLNPGDDMSGLWKRTDFEFNVDAMLFVDVDNDKYADVIAQNLPDVFWFEADDVNGYSWTMHKITTLPRTNHANGQGYELSQIIVGGKPEMVFSADDGIYYIVIPDNPLQYPWETVRAAFGTAAGEPFGLGDVNDDGKVDIIGSVEYEHMKSYSLNFYENPGNKSADWNTTIISRDVMRPDCIISADINGDSLADIVVSEERYPEVEPTASLYWFEKKDDNGKISWKKHLITTRFTMQNLDVADMDNDGDLDIVTNEAMGDKKLLIYENNGQGQFSEHIIYTGVGMHLGARCFDLDCDGDYDIVGACWFGYEDLHLWRNDTMTKLK
jgi:hypothetical protein